MTIKLTTTDTESKITNIIISVCSPIFDFSKQVSNIKNLFTTIGSIFKINIDQLNQSYNRIFIDTVSGQDLDNYINDLTKIKRKNGESDNDYRDRYYKFVFEYNSSEKQVKQIVFDVTGENPALLVSGTKRTAFWGEPNNPDCIARSFYNNSFKIPTLWGSESSGFTGYIFFSSRPSDDIIKELCFTINYVRSLGTIIYLVFPDTEVTELFNYRLTNSDSYIDTYRSENNMIIMNFDHIFELNANNDISGNNNSMFFKPIKHYNLNEIFDYLFEELSFDTDNSLITTIEPIAQIDNTIFNLRPNNINIQEMEIIDNEPDRVIIHTRLIDGYNQVVIRGEDGSYLFQLTSDASDKSYCKFSPDYTKIVFCKLEAGKSDICMMNIDGADMINLTSDLTGNFYNPTISVENDKIAFTDDNGISHVGNIVIGYEIDVNTGDNKVINCNFDKNDKIFYQNQGNTDVDNYINICNKDGTYKQQIVLTSNNNSDTHFSLSNDNSYLIWSKYINSSENEIILYNLLTNEQETITTNNAKNLLPKLSPNNKEAIYVVQDSSGNKKLWKVDIKTKARTEFTNDVTQNNDNYPDWGYTD